MKFSSETIRKAWAIRKEAAKEIGCKVSEVIWSECLKMAVKKDVTTIISSLGKEVVVDQDLVEWTKVVTSVETRFHRPTRGKRVFVTLSDGTEVVCSDKGVLVGDTVIKQWSNNGGNFTFSVKVA